MSDDFYNAAKAEINHFSLLWPQGTQLLLKGKPLGGLLGFALDSETLEPQVVAAGADDQIVAAPAKDVKASKNMMSIDEISKGIVDLRSVRHRKGGIYTVFASVLREDERFVLYVSHHDKIWWLRPRSMFIDGRFTGTQDAPLQLQDILND